MKNRKTYKILTACSVMFPLNRFYLGNLKGVFLRSITMNYMFFGWLADLLYMDKTFDEAMAKRGFVNTDVRNKKGE
jgi:hypothetical protein